MVDVDSMYRTYAPMVLRRCTRLLRDEAKGVDAMHDVFVQLLKHHPSHSASHNSPPLPLPPSPPPNARHNDAQ